MLSGTKNKRFTSPNRLMVQYYVSLLFMIFSVQMSLVH